MKKVMAAMAVTWCAWLLPLSAAAQAGKGLSQPDISKIKDVAQIYVKSALAKDWTMFVNIFLDDGAIYPPNAVALKGRAAIRAWAAKYPPITEFKVSTNEVYGRDDLAYALGTYVITIAPPGVTSVKDSGKFVEVLRKQASGQWLIAVDMFSSDLPAAPPPK